MPLAISPLPTKSARAVTESGHPSRICRERWRIAVPLVSTSPSIRPPSRHLITDLISRRAFGLSFLFGDTISLYAGIPRQDHKCRKSESQLCAPSRKSDNSIPHALNSRRDDCGPAIALMLIINSSNPLLNYPCHREGACLLPCLPFPTRH